MLSFLSPQTERRSRSKSPAARKSRETNDYYPDTERTEYRKPSRPKYSETESEEESGSDRPRYVERTPVDYEPKASKEDRRRARQAYEDEYNEKPRRRYAEEALEDTTRTRGRYERDVINNYGEIPNTAHQNGAMYPNGESLQYAAFAGNGTVPGGFPGQSVKPIIQQTQPRPKSSQYADVGKVQYAQVDPSTVQYNYNNGDRGPSYSNAYNTVTPQPGKPTKSSIAAQQKAYVDDRYSRKPSSRHDPDQDENGEYLRSVADMGRRQSYHRERSPNPSPNRGGLSTEQLRKGLGRLSTGSIGAATLGVGNTPATAGGRPPPSPLMEAYRGTYQTISPLPSPLALVVRKRDEDDLSDLELDDDSGSDDELTKKIKALQREKNRVGRLKGIDPADIISPRSSASKLDVARMPKSRTSSNASAISTKSRKTVSFYNPDTDADKIADALKGTRRSADVKPLLKIMPRLTNDEMTLLKGAYKNFAKINGQGINLSKHIKARVPGNLGKILYATSLGRYESDAYWANCFYQSGASRRELLIESLVGRSNETIRQIKDVFKDKRYDDDLEKCMKAELKADKFRNAILLALEERRMTEGIAIDMRLVHEDGMDLHDALSNPGGETAMIKIVMLRSDAHLKEVLRYYEKSYRRNFARDMISKSQNLVGETLAHMLNGALNKAMRDAILLHQAIDEFSAPPQTARTPNPAQKPAAGRAELLISRVVRLHWEPKHLERVKREYEERYQGSVMRALARDVQAGMKTDEGRAWVGFAIDLLKSNEA